MIFNHHDCAGHGGANRGTLSLGIPEKDWNLELCDFLYAALREPSWNVQCSRSRSHDLSTSHRTRGRLSKSARAHMVTSIHVNATGHPGAHTHGVEVYHRRNDVWSAQVGKAIVDAFPAELRRDRPRRRILEAWDDPDNPHDDWEVHPQAVVEAHSAPICVLVECGYATDEKDREVLLSNWGKRAILVGILAGVTRAMKIWEQEP